MVHRKGSYNPFLYSIVFVYLFFIFLFLIIGYYVEKNSVFFVCSGEAEHKLVEVFYLPGRQPWGTQITSNENISQLLSWKAEGLSFYHLQLTHFFVCDTTGFDDGIPTPSPIVHPVSLQRRQICYRWGTPAYWSLVPRSSMFYLFEFCLTNMWNCSLTQHNGDRSSSVIQLLCDLYTIRGTKAPSLLARFSRVGTLRQFGYDITTFYGADRDVAGFSYWMASRTVYLLLYLSLFGRFVVYFCITKLCTRYFNRPALKKKAKCFTVINCTIVPW
jgi:hypothetical protein